MQASVLLGVITSASAVSAETLEETAAVFGSRQTILNISLSPSGNKVAYITPAGKSAEAVYVVDLNGGAEPTPLIRFAEPNARLTSCSFATETRLVCRVYVIDEDMDLLLGFTRMLSLSTNGEKMVALTQRQSSGALDFIQDGGNIISLDVAGEANKILMTREWVKEITTGTRMGNPKEGLGVDIVDVTTGRRKVSIGPDNGAIGYIADENGDVRMKVRQLIASRGMQSNSRLFFFKNPEQGGWKLLSKIKVDSQTYTGLQPVAVDGAKNIAYAFAEHNGFEALYSLPLEESSEPTLVASRPDADVDSLIRIGRNRRVVGASYATDRRKNIYFDPDLKRLSDGLSKALPGGPLVTVLGASSDESKLMLVASSDVDPGMTYLYDKESRRLEELLPVRNYMADRTLAEMKSVSFPTADGTMIPGYLTLPVKSDGKNLPAIVLPHGGPSARDEWGFDWLVQFFAARGYAVLQPNYRGSSGYGTNWFGKNGFKAWETAIGDVNDAGRWLVSEGIADSQKLAIVGWSYGGYAALQSQVVDPELYKAVVAIAPVTDLEQLRQEALRYTSGRLVDQFIGRGPHVRAGSPRQNVDYFKSPVLMFHGDLDQNVDVDQSRQMENRLSDAGKEVKYVEFKNVAHSLRDSKIRSDMLVEIDRFLTANRPD